MTRSLGASALYHTAQKMPWTPFKDALCLGNDTPQISPLLRMSCTNRKGKMIPHALLIPLPAQGHINPMMHLGRKLVSDGFLITFLNTEESHQRMIKANNDHGIHQCIRMISAPQPQPAEVVPAGNTEKNVIDKFFGDVEIALAPSVVDKVIRKMNDRSEDQKITCILADVWTCFGFRAVAQLHHIYLAALHTNLVSTFAIRYFAPKLVSLGLLPSDDIPKEDKTQEYLPSMPPLRSTHLPWLDEGEFMFRHVIRMVEETAKIEWILFNSVYELEAGVADDLSKEVGVYPIGPLISPELLEEERNISTVMATPSFWKDDMECLEWLEKQKKQSVIYVAFGSIAVWNKRQMEEFALGLEATQRPFLWVVRSGEILDGSSAVLPAGFMDRVKERGSIVCWAPQVRVLSHPSIACFVTHCGWNSIQESIAMEVPMLCCPYFADQFLNSTYVADVWKVGLRLEANCDGLMEKEEIMKAIERLVATEGEEIKEEIKRWSSVAKNAVKGGGSSSSNYRQFVDAMKR